MNRGWQWAVIALGLSTISAAGITECEERDAGHDPDRPHHPASHYANRYCGLAGGDFITATVARSVHGMGCSQVDAAYPQVEFRAWPWNFAVDTIVSAKLYDHASDTSSTVQVRLKLSGGFGKDSLSIGATDSLHPLIFSCEVKTPCI